MKLNFNNIENVNKLIESGFERNQAEQLIKVLSKQVHRNVYDRQEIDEMLAQTVKDVFTEQRREFDKRMEVAEKRFDDELKELRNHKRWVVGTIIAVGAVIIAYLRYFH